MTGHPALAAIAASALLLIVMLCLSAPEPAGTALALLLFATVAGTVALRLDGFHPHAVFGAANTVTLGRAVLVCLLAALSISDTSGVVPLAAGVAALALVLDGVDGWLARRSGTTSRFGARFDMEVDALLVLVLSFAVWSFGKAGPWVLLAGLLRYFFLTAGLAWPALATTLPPSLRRKTICIVQIAVMTILLLPMISPPASSLLALGALMALVWSFALDTALLLHRRRV